jgi:hypothetical protein
VNNKIINLVLLKQEPLNVPYVLDDTVLCVQNLLSRAGFSARVSFNSIDPNQINVIFGVQMPGTATIAQIRSVASPANTLIFNTEQLSGGSAWVTDEYLNLLADYGCLDYTSANTDYLLNWSKGAASAFEFPLVPSQGFLTDQHQGPEKQNNQYDLAFYGSTGNGGRIQRLQELLTRGIRLKCFAGVYGANLPKEILDCSAVLNLHGYESALFEVVRCLRPVALGIPVFSDVSTLPKTVNWEESGVFFLPKNDFPAEIARILSDPEKLLEASQRMIDFVNDAKWPTLALHVMQAVLAAKKQKS